MRRHLLWMAPGADRQVPIVRLDMRGHGRSQTAGGYHWTLQSMLADPEAVIDDSPVP
ncbi:MAG: hypothetical protein GKR94_24510 [Gammaproteobacteria bacterium]|nr:hypothetical protein [Gammaproteobacteria bacterium]